jgi:hypothetical protein
VDFFNPPQKGNSSVAPGTSVDQKPDAFPFGIDLTGSVFARSSTGTVAESLGAPLRTDKDRVTEDAFSAALAAEKWDFDDVFTEKHCSGQEFFFGRRPALLDSGQCFMTF